MEFALGFGLGLLALPWYYLAILSLLFVVDIVLVENEEFGWTFTSLLVVGGLVTWLGTDINPFTWVFYNAASVVKFLVGFFVVGSLWSVLKWYFYLLKVRDRIKDSGRAMKRPYDSYAANNKGLIMAWIGWWPFSVLGTLFGDFLTRIVTSIFNVLSGLYESMANKVFAGFDEEE